MTGMVTIRPFTAGDDLALAELLHDPRTPAEHAARAMFRADSDGGPGDGPVSRCVVATLDGADLPVGAAAILESPLHPTRAWVHVEVAEQERGRGVGSELLAVVRGAAAGTPLEGLPLRARVAAGESALETARSRGFSPMFTTRVVEIEALALGNLGADRVEEFEVVATGSVALTSAFADWYFGVNRADPAGDLSLGRVNADFLSDAAGAHGAALLRRDGEVAAFAVSYAQPEPGGELHPADAAPAAAEATELTVGVAFDGRDAALDTAHDSAEFQAALQDAGVIVARLSTDVPVVVEVTDEMPVLTELVDGLLAAGRARVLQEYITLAG